MRLARAYFDYLLRDADPIEAVATLAQFWSTRADATLPGFGLSAPEYTVQLCLIYFGEVGNGGITQYFMNRGCELVMDTCKALTEVGFTDVAASLRSASAAWLDAPDTDDFADRSDPSAGHTAQIDSRLLDYIRRNAGDILVSELAG